MMELFDGRYEKLEHLGSGAFAEVWKVRDRDTDIVEALKIYTSRAGIYEDSVKLFTHEFALLANANHPNLVRPLHFAISKPEEYPYLRMKYCNNGSMKKRIGKMTEEDTWHLIRDISSALNYLHKMNPQVIHQDIKPDNILIDSDKYMLSDFGVSTRVKSGLSRLSVLEIEKKLASAGSWQYMAPERFSESKTPIMASDIWSLGATLYEVLTMELPFVMGGLTQSKGEKVPHLGGTYSSTLKQVIEDCLFLEPWKRPRAEQLYEVAKLIVDGQPLPKQLPWRNIEEDTAPSPPPPLPPNEDKTDNTNPDNNDVWPNPPEPIPISISKAIVIAFAFSGIAVGIILALL